MTRIMMAAVAEVGSLSDFTNFKLFWLLMDKLNKIYKSPRSYYFQLNSK
jgi:hypothetical protein